MPDRKKVINGLTAIYDEAHDRWVYCQYIRDKLLMLIDEAIPDALTLLKEEPVKPVNVRWEMNIRGGTCPRCLNWIQQSYNYCPFCGKAVTWDD